MYIYSFEWLLQVDVTIFFCQDIVYPKYFPRIYIMYVLVFANM
jgi:hypothetical protein